MGKAIRSTLMAIVLAGTLVTTARATPPPPMPPMPPENPAFLATPEPVLESTGDAKVDAYRDRLLTDYTSGPWRAYLVRLLAGVRADPAILEQFDRLAAIREPKDYVRHYVTTERIRRGRQLYRQLKSTAAKPDEMPLELRLAMWGMLADYGARQPRYDALQALLVLGAYSRGGAEYEFQLHHAASQILSGAVPRPKLKAHATGKLGQTHTPAARFPDWARDGNGDGKIDIWSSRADILATIGGNSWEGYAGIPVAVAVKVPNFDPADPREARMLQALNASPNVPPGILERWDGRPWTPEERGHGSTYLPPFSEGGPAYLMLRPAWPVNSHDPILPMYAGSDTNMGFALAASLLADAIAGRPLPPLPR
jgi:membrane-bound lytic murein transglycosylase B